ncbi:hypothetical protein MPS_4490 [Mycobacterium pseudoshottsii JCM 15466]|nr:hypothetical protein MPS_4490 [Mycobacterium pseudoshottsii JCM 15466]
MRFDRAYGPRPGRRSGCESRPGFPRGPTAGAARRTGPGRPAAPALPRPAPNPPCDAGPPSARRWWRPRARPPG